MRLTVVFVAVAGIFRGLWSLKKSYNYLGDTDFKLKLALYTL